MNNREISWMGESAHIYEQMNQSLLYGALNKMGALILSYIGCHSKELVYGNRALPWH